MAAKLETVVRPFQEGNVFTARVLAPTAQVDDGNDVVTEWGNPIQLIAKAIGIQDLNTGGKHWTEVSRTETITRVTNPDDDTQYVDVAQITSLRMRDERGNERDLTLNIPT